MIDGLSTTHPNRTFWWTAKDCKTYYYEGGSDTVNFYRSLPTQNFEIIILRVHSAMNPENTELAMFTNDQWTDTKARTIYLVDVLNDRLVNVGIEENATHFFGIRKYFVIAIKGTFENTTIIIMGYHGLDTQSMAEAFIQKGAKNIHRLGWFRSPPICKPGNNKAIREPDT